MINESVFKAYDIRGNYPNDFAFAVKRYLDPFSLLIIYCDDLNVYKKELIEAKNLVSHLKKIEGVSKIKLFLIGFKIKYARFSRFIFRKKYGLRWFSEHKNTLC